MRLFSFLGLVGEGNLMVHLYLGMAGEGICGEYGHHHRQQHGQPGEHHNRVSSIQTLHVTLIADAARLKPRHFARVGGPLNAVLILCVITGLCAIGAASNVFLRNDIITTVHRGSCLNHNIRTACFTEGQRAFIHSGLRAVGAGTCETSHSTCLFVHGRRVGRLASLTLTGFVNTCTTLGETGRGTTEAGLLIILKRVAVLAGDAF